MKVRGGPGVSIMLFYQFAAASSGRSWINRMDDESDAGEYWKRQAETSAANHMFHNENLKTAAYANQPGYSAQPAGLPENLKSLLSLAEAWAFVGETATFQRIDHASIEELTDFANRFRGALPAIESLCFGPAGEQIPVPDEVAVFQIALTTFKEAEPVLRSRLSGRR